MSFEITRHLLLFTLLVVEMRNNILITWYVLNFQNNSVHHSLECSLWIHKFERYLFELEILFLQIIGDFSLPQSSILICQRHSKWSMVVKTELRRMSSSIPFTKGNSQLFAHITLFNFLWLIYKLEGSIFLYLDASKWCPWWLKRGSNARR